MKLWILAAAGAGCLLGMMPVRSGSGDWVLFLGGDIHGHLSPCGCTKPMSGGIKRRATAIKLHGITGRTTVLENGGLVANTIRQDQLKLETLAEALAKMGVDAIHLSDSDARLGRGAVLAAQQLSGNALMSSSLASPAPFGIRSHLRSGPLLVGGIAADAEALALAVGAVPLSADDAVSRLLREAESSSLEPVLMLRGPESEARRIAAAFPKLRFIQYVSYGSPSGLQWEGSVAMASPGSLGRAIVRILVRDGRVADYRVIELGPEFEDDPLVARIYRGYLARVSEERLLDRLPRLSSTPFAGTATCGACHGKTVESWKKTDHAHALLTLETEGHDRDPDCVGCHVVGLESTRGFKSRVATPRLAAVGCESCHGSGVLHARRPKVVRMGKVGEKSCLGCHTPEQSPKFDFSTFWHKIQHK